MRKFGANGAANDKPDAVAVEHYLAVDFAGRGVATLACTPRHLEELVAGFLLSQSLLPAAARPGDLGWRCEFSPDRRVAKAAILEPGSREEGPGGLPLEDGRLVTSGCGAALVKDQARALLETSKVTWSGQVAAADLVALAARLNDAPLFHLTGGAHSALAGEVGRAEDRAGGACRNGAGAPPTLLVLREDIGRHNAVDKVVGHLWLTGRLAGVAPRAARPALSPARVIATSGRISSDVVIKAARSGFPFIVSHGAPTVMAVEMARELGVTVVGFARGSRLNAYSHGDRLLS